MQNDVFDEYERADKELKDIMDKIHILCKQQKYDEAEKVTQEEYKPIEEKWRNCLRRFLQSTVKKL